MYLEIDHKGVLIYTHHESYYYNPPGMVFSTAPWPKSAHTTHKSTFSRIHSSHNITLGIGAVFGILDEEGIFKYMVPDFENLQPHPVYLSTRSC